MSLNLATILREGARRHPEQVALSDGRVSLSYAELDDAARRLAAGLMGLGVAREQHVALMMPNVVSFTVAYYACHYAATPVVPLNVMLTPAEIDYHLTDADAVELIVHHSLLEQAREGFGRVDGCRHLIVSDLPEGAALPAGATSLSALVADSEPVGEVPDTRADDTAALLYTSGTTGKAKGAELTHFNMFYNADVAAREHRIAGHSVALAALPLFHSFGQTVIQNATLMRGGQVTLLDRFEAGAALELMASQRVTFFAGVPTMYFGLLHHPQAAHHDLSALEVCVSGGAPMPVEVMRAFDERHGVSIVEGYGLSETSPLASLNVLDAPKRPGSIGVPLWGVEFSLVDDEGRVIEDSGVPGELRIKGHNVMKGYYGRPESTRKAIRDGWLHTGDIATRDDDGYYFIVDRKKDMILRGGYNVYPREVEEALYAHPSVAEAAVVGVPDERLGEEVKAVVALKPGASVQVDELAEWLAERVAAYKRPRCFELVAELPKGPTGKILKRALREP